MAYNAVRYPKTEEVLNVITHGLGFLLSIAALVLLVVFASLKGNVWHIVGVAVYGVSLVVLYLASTLYHVSKKQSVRNKLNIFDHASIYVLIAGTYTPFLLVTLHGVWGWTLLAVIWGLAVGGILFKIFFIGKYDLISALLYVLMGWLIIVAIKPLNQNLATGGLWWLLGGGISYSVGAVFYMIKKIPYNHAIFHIWVLLGSLAHFIAVFFYVIP